MIVSDRGASQFDTELLISDISAEFEQHQLGNSQYEAQKNNETVISENIRFLQSGVIQIVASKWWVDPLCQVKNNMFKFASVILTLVIGLSTVTEAYQRYYPGKKKILYFVILISYLILILFLITKHTSTFSGPHLLKRIMSILSKVVALEAGESGFESLMRQKLCFVQLHILLEMME